MVITEELNNIQKKSTGHGLLTFEEPNKKTSIAVDIDEPNGNCIISTIHPPTNRPQRFLTSVI
jgi:hypothetical protein